MTLKEKQLKKRETNIDTLSNHYQTYDPQNKGVKVVDLKKKNTKLSNLVALTNLIKQLMN